MYLIFFKHYRDQAKQQRGMQAEPRIEERNNDLNHRFGKQPLKEFLTIFSRTFGKRGVKLGFQLLDLGSGLAGRSPSPSGLIFNRTYLIYDREIYASLLSISNSQADRKQLSNGETGTRCSGSTPSKLESL